MHSVYSYIFNIIYSGSFVDNIVELHYSFAMPSILYSRLQFFRERLLIMPYYHSSRDYQFTRLDYVSAALVCYEKKMEKKTQNAATEKKYHQNTTSIQFTSHFCCYYSTIKQKIIILSFHQFLFLLVLLSTSMS